ncbi:MAG: ATP-binding cassette domain-containing protein [Clostridia bacterium]|nr:ATP-binding cassette domain-containing protein [Clostridia bacterium]
MIELKDVSRTFDSAEGRVEAVRSVSLTINAGEIYGIIGASGAGKSTLVRCINLLEHPNSGTVTVDGQELTALSPKELRVARKNIGMIFQSFNLMASRTVLDNVAYPLHGRNMSRQQVVDKVRELLRLVELSDKENAYPSQLSGGQKQRVAIARALATDPKVLLCDEATSALDPQTTLSILELLKRVNRELGITVVIITHEMAVIKEICHKVAVMDQGRVIEEGDVFSVFAAPQQLLTRQLVESTLRLEKINSLVEEDAEVVRLAPGEQLLKLKYLGSNVSDPLISEISRKFDVNCNIIFGNIEIISQTTLGTLVLIISGYPDSVSAAIQYLIDNKVEVEVLHHAVS